MEQTKNYKLNKPGQDDFYNVEDFNQNADILDQALKELADGGSDQYVSKTGDTMTGELILPSTIPTKTYQAVHKKYVDELVAGEMNVATQDINITINSGENINDALTRIPKFGNGFSVSININGTFDNHVEFIGFKGYKNFTINVGAGSVFNRAWEFRNTDFINIVGNYTSKPKFSTDRECITASLGSFIRLEYFELESVKYPTCVQTGAGCNVLISSCDINALGNGISTFSGALQVSGGSIIFAINTTIKSSTYVGLSTHGGLIYFYGANNATTKSIKYNCGQIINY